MAEALVDVSVEVRSEVRAEVPGEVPMEGQASAIRDEQVSTFISYLVIVSRRLIKSPQCTSGWLTNVEL